MATLLETIHFSSLMNRQFDFLVSIFFGWKRERERLGARGEIFLTKEKEEMGEVDKNHLRMEKREGRSSFQRERDAANAARLPKCWWPPVAL